MAGPWEKFKNTTTTPDQAEVSTQGPWTKYRTTPSETEVLSGEDPLMQGLEQNRQEAETEVVAPADRQTTGIRSYDDLYGGIQEKYSDLPPGNHPFDQYQQTEKQQVDMVMRDREMEDIYLRTGREKNVMGVPVRVQTERKNNPDYDPSLPTSESNPEFIDKEFLVDKPDTTTLRRIGYQVFENIAGGVGDFITEGKLLKEGDVGKSLPDVVPDGEGEALVTELTTFVLGPAAITKGLKVGAKGVSATSGLAGQVAKSLSPEGMAAIRGTYDTVLKATGSTVKAFNASNNLAKRLVVGMAIGVQEGIVAPDGSEGLVVSPETLKSTFGISDERAKDLSFMLDTPVISGTLNILGGLYNTVADKMVKPTFGGLRNLSPLGVPVGTVANKLSINSHDAGLRVLTWLDPGLAKASPEEFVYRVNVLSGALDRGATKNVQLAGANREVKMDTPAAFMSMAKDYYDLSYGHLKEVLGTKEYNEFINIQAAETANRLFELRTAVSSDPRLNTQMTQQSSALSELFDEASGNTPDGNLSTLQEQTGQILGNTQTGRIEGAEQALDTARTKAEASELAADKAITNDPEISKIFEDYANSVGSTAAIENRLKESVSEPMYRSYKKLKTETDEAYKKIADSGAQADVNSILEIIGPEGIQDSFFKNIAESVQADDSFNNVYNKVRKNVSDEIARIEKSSHDPQFRMEKLKELRKNISEDQLDWLKGNQDGDVVQMATDAKDKFIKLQTSWRDEESLKNLTNRYGRARLRGEELPAGVGPGQGVTNWDINAIRTVQNGLSGPTKEIFRQSLDRAAQAGGEDVSKGVAEYYTAMSLSNVANRIASGGKESVGTLRQGLKDYANLLDNMGSPLLEKVRKLETNIQTLENVKNIDKKALEQVTRETQEIIKEAQHSVLRKFVSNGENLGASDVNARLNSIFKAQDSESQIRQILKEADGLGEDGKVVREALQGTYLDHIKSKVFSNRSTGVSDVKDGVISQGYKVNETNVRKLFEANSKDMANFRLLFADTPEVFEEIKDTVSTLQNLTRTTSRSDGNIFKDAIDKSQDPVQGTNSLIQFTLGVLNPTATRAKRVLGPLAAQNLEQVKQAQDAIFMAMLTDPKAFAEISKNIAAGVQDQAINDKFRSLLMRGTARSIFTQESDVNQDMENLK